MPNKPIATTKPVAPVSDESNQSDEQQAELARAREALGITEDDPNTAASADANIAMYDEDDLGEEPDDDSYESMPMADFGQAMLRGMGWTPKTGVGRTNRSVVAAPDLGEGHNGRLGLGADASTIALKKAAAKLGWDEKKAAAAKELQSRVISGPALQVTVGALVEVMSGPCSGMYGRVTAMKPDTTAKSVKSNQMDSNSTANDTDSMIVSIKLNAGGSTECSALQVSVIDEKALPNDHPALLDYDYRYGPAQPLLPTKKQSESSSNDQKDADPKDIKTTDKPSSSKDSKKNSDWTWVRPNIVVSIVSKRHSHYGSKGIVEYISENSGRCYVQLDYHREQGKSKQRPETVSVDYERQLQTVVPDRDGSVVMVRGPYRGCKGWVERKERGKDSVEVSIEVDGKMKIVSVSLDDVCEWKRAL
jgi:G patch domain/KOW motif-containing protein